MAHVQSATESSGAVERCTTPTPLPRGVHSTARSAWSQRSRISAGASKESKAAASTRGPGLSGSACPCQYASESPPIVSAAALRYSKSGCVIAPSRKTRSASAYSRPLTSSAPISSQSCGSSGAATSIAPLACTACFHCGGCSTEACAALGATAPKPPPLDAAGFFFALGFLGLALASAAPSVPSGKKASRSSSSENRRS
mmetsp:Transcript_32461/g.77292  ORF Transcript_32461/g.77292 Transcript_32461/m.77292 type:complete len:200 (+) Transcript_32461:256-855(+)